MADLDEALLLDPRSASGRTNRGFVNVARGDVTAALADFDESLRIRPDDPPTLVARGGLLREKGELGRAVEDYRRALAAAPADWAERADVERILRDIEVLLKTGR